jgi:hypothetical protein
MGCFVLFYTSRVVCKGRLTMEEIHLQPEALLALCGLRSS